MEIKIEGEKVSAVVRIERIPYALSVGYRASLQEGVGGDEENMTIELSTGYGMTKENAIGELADNLAVIFDKDFEVLGELLV